MDINPLYKNVLNRPLKNKNYSFYKIAFQRRYYGARYQDPKTSRWLSTDPALASYLPTAGGDNSQLPGMGGVFNTVNLHLYHYAGNNPVKYTDPTGRASFFDSLVPGANKSAQSVEAFQIPKTGNPVTDAMIKIGVGVIKILAGGDIAQKGTTAGLGVAAGSGGIATVGGIAIIAASVTVGGAIIADGVIDIAEGLAELSAGNGAGGSTDNSGNMKRLSQKDIESRTGTNVHDVKNVIRDQYGAEMKDAGVSKNFDLYENNGELIIKGNNGGAELNLNTSLESFGVN